MTTNPEALIELYKALGGDESEVEGATQNVEVLNKIAAMYDGADDAVYNPEAIENIAEVVTGGGGSSDFSTAEVTITLNTGEVTAVNVPFADTEYEDAEASTPMPEVGTPMTLNVILYKGKAFFNVLIGDVPVSISVTGDIIMEHETGGTISGNGTITVNDL